jgi:cyclic pyranopterin monophosphate synthase
MDFSHLDEKGNAKMVDLGSKDLSLRKAVARGKAKLPKPLYQLSVQDDLVTKKGSVVQTAILAGIMAAKKTSELIPLCHGLALDNCEVDIQLVDNQIFEITCTVSTTAKTGVEMEALTGVSVAALTIYDMCKSLGQGIIISDILLVQKTGGKKDYQLPNS